MPRHPEPRIVDPATHPTRYVCLTVAAQYLETDVRILNTWIDLGKLPYYRFGRRRKVKVSDLVAYERAIRSAGS